MRVLNPKLYRYLQRRFGEVRVVKAGETRVEHWDGRENVVDRAGESYDLCCPLCGDNRYRLSISYLWLTQPDRTRTRRITSLAHCYNEDCGVREEEFYGPIMQALDSDSFDGLLEAVEALQPPPPPRVAVRLPTNRVLLRDLPPDHPALEFLREKYRDFSVPLFEQYQAEFCWQGDAVYPMAGQRVIFPVYDGQELVGWQGRSVLKHEKERKWYLNPGFRKILYRQHEINRADPLIIAEGITSSMFMGPQATAIFGKTLDYGRQTQVAAGWADVLIATDPDTFYPPPPKERKGGQFRLPSAFQMKADLSRLLPRPPKLIRWPKELMELARRRSMGEEGLKIPDAADLGFAEMTRVINASL